MRLHRNAKLGLQGRHTLVVAIEQGLSLREAARRHGVSPASAHRWWHRWCQASAKERRTLSCLYDRSSRPSHSPRLLSPAEEEPILRARRQTGLGPARIATLVRRAASTVWKVLARHGLSRRPPTPRRPARAYEWSRAGALLHVDTKPLARFRIPGHRMLGREGVDRRGGSGYEQLHCVVDDKSRLAYVELHPQADGETAARVLSRAVVFFRELGCAPPEAVMTDNAFCYTRSRAFQAVLARIGARHIRTPPYTPRWNGKVERFIQTLLREWAYVRIWESSRERARALLSFLRYYNRQRPHGSLGGRPPISRVHNLCGSDN